jgi:hypothetical protein
MAIERNGVIDWTDGLLVRDRAILTNRNDVGLRLGVFGPDRTALTAILLRG